MKNIFSKLITFFIINGLLLIVFGISTIIYPNLLNYLIAVFLIIIGINNLYFAYKTKILIKKSKNLLKVFKN